MILLLAAVAWMICLAAGAVICWLHHRPPVHAGPTPLESRDRIAFDWPNRKENR